MEYTKQDKIILWLYLCLGSGFNKLMGLMDYYGDLNGVWDNFDKNDDNLAFLSAKTKSALAKTRNMEYVNNCIEKWKNPKLTTVFDNSYPRLLKETANPPLLLFYDGDLSGLNRCIGVVGSRSCTKYGLDCAKEISYDLAAEGVCIVSGGARGIDTKAHEGALEAGGKTVCVFGCGLNIAYPPENERLFYNIIEKSRLFICFFFTFICF